MPELPEVETIARCLREGNGSQPSILHHRILKVKLLWERTLAEPRPARLPRLLINRHICGISRRGKFLVFDLEDLSMLIHLRMSGDLFVRAGDAPLEKHDRLILWLGGQGGMHQLAFNDTRKFGRVWVTRTPDGVLSKLGPEPLDEMLTPEEFHHMLTRHQRQLKPLLLDQTFLAGLGNIYTDEGLHLARLHPLRRADTLSLAEAQNLLKAIRSTLCEGIARNGASIDWVYRGGDFQNYFRVYGREGQPCPACGELITRLVVAQRGTHVCEHCQINCVGENQQKIM
jgi:formamidopyrimidine-DNA glycosylase